MNKLSLLLFYLLFNFQLLKAQSDISLPLFNAKDLVFRFEESMVYASISLSDGSQTFQTGIELDEKNIPATLVAKIITQIKSQGYRFISSQSGCYGNGNVSYVVSYYLFNRE